LDQPSVVEPSSQFNYTEPRDEHRIIPFCLKRERPFSEDECVLQENCGKADV
jgi:hypothetical protein